MRTLYLKILFSNFIYFLLKNIYMYTHTHIHISNMYLIFSIINILFFGSFMSNICGYSFSLVSSWKNFCCYILLIMPFYLVSFMLTHAIILIYRSIDRGPLVAIIESPNVQLLKSAVKVLDDFPCLNIPCDAHHNQYQVVCSAIASKRFPPFFSLNNWTFIEKTMKEKVQEHTEKMEKTHERESNYKNGPSWVK